MIGGQTRVHRQGRFELSSCFGVLRQTFSTLVAATIVARPAVVETAEGHVEDVWLDDVVRTALLHTQLRGTVAGGTLDLEHGKLRILRPRGKHSSHLPRKGHSLDFEIELAEASKVADGVIWREFSGFGRCRFATLG